MHHLSFASSNPVFDFLGLRFSAQIFTFYNVYEPDAQKLTISSLILTGWNFARTGSLLS